MHQNHILLALWLNGLCQHCLRLFFFGFAFRMNQCEELAFLPSPPFSFPNILKHSIWYLNIFFFEIARNAYLRSDSFCLNTMHYHSEVCTGFHSLKGTSAEHPECSFLRDSLKAIFLFVPAQGRMKFNKADMKFHLKDGCWSSKGDMDTENRLTGTAGVVGKKVGCMKSVTWKHTLPNVK